MIESLMIALCDTTLHHHSSFSWHIYAVAMSDSWLNLFSTSSIESVGQRWTDVKLFNEKYLNLTACII